MKLKSNDFEYENCLFLDEKHETLYLRFSYISNVDEEEDEDNDSNNEEDSDPSDEDEGLERYCWIVLDKSGREFKIESGKNFELVGVFVTDQCFGALDKYGIVRVFYGELFETCQNTPFKTPLCKSKYLKKVSYFDKNSNRFYFMDNFSFEVIRVMKINQLSSIENIPLSKESYNSLKRLGAQLPKYLEFGNVNTLQYFLNIKFSTSFLYSDEDIQKRFCFQNDGKPIYEGGDYLFINSEIWKNNRGENCNISLLVNQFEVSSQKDDFLVHVRFRKSMDGEYLMKCYKLSEFLSKLKVTCSE